MIITLSLILLLIFDYVDGACQDGSIQFTYPLNSTCYIFVKQKVPFTQAEEDCQTYPGGHLASVTNAFLDSSIAAYARYEASLDDYWIGATDLQDTDSYKWQWTDGESFSYTNWGLTQPNLSPTFNCIGVITQISTWSTFNCFDSKSYICEVPVDAVYTTRKSTTKPTVISTGTTRVSSTSHVSTGVVTGTTPKATVAPISTFLTSTTPTLSTILSTTTTTKSITTKKPPVYSCDPGWNYYQPTESCFKNVSTKHNFDDAEKICAREGATLASIHSLAELGYLNNTLEYYWYWIGLCSTDSGRTWKWADGTPVNFVPWCSNTTTPLATSCVLTTPVMYCFTNTQKTVVTYGLCKKSAAQKLNSG